MLKSSLWDYSNAYILVKGKITITEAGDDVHKDIKVWHLKIMLDLLIA